MKPPWFSDDVRQQQSFSGHTSRQSEKGRWFLSRIGDMQICRPTRIDAIESVCAAAYLYLTTRPATTGMAVKCYSVEEIISSRRGLEP